MIEKNTSSKTIWHLLEIADLLKKYGEFIVAKEGITTQQWLILLYLAGDPNIPYFDREEHKKPMMASELADAFNVSRPNITNLLKGLLKKALIVQVEDEVDRRKKRLKLTERGAELLHKLEPGRKNFNNNLFNSFDKGQRESLLGKLSQINQSLIEHFDEGIGQNS